jgi:hypothetical protein
MVMFRKEGKLSKNEKLRLGSKKTKVTNKIKYLGVIVMIDIVLSHCTL